MQLKQQTSVIAVTKVYSCIDWEGRKPHYVYDIRLDSISVSDMFDFRFPPLCSYFTHLASIAINMIISEVAL